MRSHNVLENEVFRAVPRGMAVAVRWPVRSAFATLALMLLAQTAPADTVHIVASRDTTILANDGTRSNGAGVSLFTGVNNDNFEKRALVAFDIGGSVPAGSTINSVTLTMRLTKTKASDLTVSLHAVSEAWGEAGSVGAGEGGGGAAAQSGDATWTHGVYPGTAWSTAGGAYASTASASAVIGTNLVDYSWSSPAMLADVQRWYATPSTNQGWILVTATNANRETKRFASRNNTDGTIRPRLMINFTPPPTTGACCASDGTCGVVLAPGSSCTGTYQGTGSTCSPNTCPQPTGACCSNDATATCSVTTQAGCAGIFQGIDVACGTVSCPVVLTPFVDPLPVPRKAQPITGTAGGAATYQIKIVQLQRKMHSALPPTTLWGFDDGTGPSSPGPTIEARSDQPVSVVWMNDLRENGVLRTTHYLPVDSCVAEDAAPRSVIHLHGGHVPSESDGNPEATMLPGEQVTYAYPNHQPAGTLWYHDHAMGITRLNVMMGLAGFYLVRDDAEGALALPSGDDEIPLVIQDRSFSSSGHVIYPPMWMPHYFGETILVNGVVWPYLQVRRGKYRFRVLDGSSSRSYTLSLSNGATFDVIGTDGGLLPAPVSRTSISLSPGERVDLVVDFASYAAGTEILLKNSAQADNAPDVPNVMKFVVSSEAGSTASLPTSLVPITRFDPASATMTRDLVLKKRVDMCTGEAWSINDLGWTDITEKPILGSTEIWRFINDSGNAHPMHMHLVQFQVLDHQPFIMMNGVPFPTGPAMPPPPQEAGWKDTVTVRPNEMVRVIARFDDYTGKFAYHCHILEHEDHDMMRQFEVVAPSGGDAGVDSPTNNPGGGGGGCCQTGGDQRGTVTLVGIVLFVLRRRRPR